MRGMVRIATAARIIILSISFARANNQLTIVRDGASDYSIVLPPKPTPAEKLAAKELALYLQRMSGAPMLLQPPGPIPIKALIVAEGDRLKTLGAAPIELADHRDSFAIARDGERIILTGRSSRATLFAAY